MRENSLQPRNLIEEREQKPLYASVDDYIYEAMQIIKRRENLTLHDIVNNALENFAHDYCEHETSDLKLKTPTRMKPEAQQQAISTYI